MKLWLVSNNEEFADPAQRLFWDADAALVLAPDMEMAKELGRAHIRELLLREYSHVDLAKIGPLFVVEVGLDEKPGVVAGFWARP